MELSVCDRLRFRGVWWEPEIAFPPRGLLAPTPGRNNILFFSFLYNCLQLNVVVDTVVDQNGVTTQSARLISTVSTKSWTGKSSSFGTLQPADTVHLVLSILPMIE